MLMHFEEFIANEARAVLRKVASTREAVKRADATPEEGLAFVAACREADMIHDLMEEAGLGPAYRAVVGEVDAEG